MAILVFWYLWDSSINHFAIPGAHYKKGARTLLLVRAMLALGFGSPDLLARTYTHLPTGRVYTILDIAIDYLMWDEIDAEMSSTGSEYVAASVVGQRDMSVLHMLVEMFGSIRIAQQEPVSACATATSYPASDSDWMQRAARFFEDHAPGVGQHGPPSPLLPRDTLPIPSAETRLHALPHADSVPRDGTG
ncbi:hypothetical protein CYMTET_7764 [Cymbomonas tetramitiformis]|uniref:Uncharacterized protein n=1 Tax=Cymbomonas tetramitiformis TaxID=36881 RepID=A0AAE0GUS8_9CHLO|nr:hypothetical protein CYMTET_7764 [Cymbomonas tetramitiformis]